MDRDYSLHRQWLLERLRQAEDRINDGERHIGRQLELIREIDNIGQDSTVAKRLHVTYVKLQDMRVADRDRLIKELQKTPPED